jgi:uncharacterized phiE125 gp8 family phage protein
MRISFTATDQPATEPVTPAELRAQVRVDDGGDDAMLMGYLLAARQAAETFLGRPILPTPMLARLEEWPGSSGISGARLVLDAPVITVDAVTYTALDGTTTAWTASASGYVLRDAAGGTKALRPASGVHGWCKPTRVPDATPEPGGDGTVMVAASLPLECPAVAAEELARLVKMLRRHGKARITLSAQLTCAGTKVAAFSGEYVAVRLAPTGN